MMGYHSNQTDVACLFNAWGTIFFNLMYIFLTATIAFNLQVVFIHRRQNIRKFEITFVSISVASALFLSGWPLILGKFGYDAEFDSCWYLHQKQTLTLIWEWCTFHFWVCASVVYSIFVVTWVTRKLIARRHEISEHHNPDNLNFSPEYVYHLKIMNYTVARILGYAVVPILTQTPILISCIYVYIHSQAPTTLERASVVATSLQGLFNAFAFTLDPALRIFFSRRKERRPSASPDSFEFLKPPSFCTQLHLNRSSRFDTLTIEDQLRAL
ncbi:hypothetical protein K7432_010610 [Basidiobolus ranarum]|uniref:Opsin n=1 Tax=Basidiobolus ranarum TaxID=34480 RepID=A0ABR2WNF9_9FUNG